MDRERYTLGSLQHSDKMCLDKMQYTHGSFITAGSTAYSIVQKIKHLIDELFNKIRALCETITDDEIDSMWGESPEPVVTIDDEGYLVGSVIDEDGFMITDGIDYDEDYLQLKQ